jgi:hypothetical protein
MNARERQIVTPGVRVFVFAFEANDGHTLTSKESCIAIFQVYAFKAILSMRKKA